MLWALSSFAMLLTSPELLGASSIQLRFDEQNNDAANLLRGM